MDWLGLGKYTFTFGSTAFDIGSDITNSLDFLGVFNKDTYPNTTLLPSNNVTYLNTTTMPLCNTQKSTDCAAMDQRQDLIWGILSLSIIFLPGALLAFASILELLYEDKRPKILLWITFAIPLLAVAFPFLVLYKQSHAIITKCRKRDIEPKDQLKITQLTGIEAFLESTIQLLLQLFTILNGYDTTPLQMVTITASFFQIARCSLVNDLETKLALTKGNTLGFKVLLKETIYRLPLYASTIIFRIGSLCLTMAYLRYYSLIPIAVLFFTQTMITWSRCKKNNYGGIGEAFRQTFNLVVCNIGVVNAYSMDQTDLFPWCYGLYYKGVEDDNSVVKFIRQSTIAAFVHHSTLLIIIMILGHFFPNAMEHWSSECDFPLKPGTQAFYWIFGAVFFMGFYSLTAIMYKAQLMTKIVINEMESKHEEVQLEEVLIKDHSPEKIENLDQFVQTENTASKKIKRRMSV